MQYASWNYRVMRFEEQGGDSWHAIHEVYYDAEGVPRSYTAFASDVLTTDEPATDALASMLTKMQAALALPVLTAADFAATPK